MRLSLVAVLLVVPVAAAAWGASEHHDRVAAETELRAYRGRPGPASAGAADGAQRETFQRAFGEEPVDPTWSADARLRIEDALRGKMPDGSKVEAIECRTSMCRIQTSHADQEHLKAFVRAAFRDPRSAVWNAPVMTLSDTPDGGPTLVTSYLAREGHRLPPAPGHG